MTAPLDNLPFLEHEDLVGAADGRQPMRDDERRASCSEAAKTILDHLLALAVETGGGFIQDEDARIGKNRAGDRDALALPTRELDAPFTYDGVVSLGKLTDELIAMCDPARLDDLVSSRARFGVSDVIHDCAVEEKVLLQHRRQLAAIVHET